MIYNDHGLNFFLDQVPTFALGCADRYDNADEGWGLTTQASFEGDAQFSWHIAESLIRQEFDLTTCQEMLVDHAISIPFELAYPGAEKWPVKLVPIGINTVQHPLPSARRCLALGRSVHRALASWTGAERVVVIGTGGLSHQVHGERAGFLNEAWDAEFLELLEKSPEVLVNLRIADYAYVLESGVLKLEGPAAPMAQDDEIVRAYLGG